LNLVEQEGDTSTLLRRRLAEGEQQIGEVLPESTESKAF
jgi:hypothetical protein